MSVIKVKDSYGNWVTLPALKGDRGERGYDGTNNNLLDNGWFQINQRGTTAITASSVPTYYSDRWIFTACAGTVSANNCRDGISIKFPGINPYYGQYAEVKQKIEDTTLFGKKVTLSAKILITSSDGNVTQTEKVFSHTFVMPNDETGESVNIYLGSTITECNLWVGKTSGYPSVAIRTASGDTLNIRAIKLEIGEYSTLDMDWYPNAAVELMKCKRRYVRFNSGKIVHGLIDTDQKTFNFTDSELSMLVGNPTFTGSGNLCVRINSSYTTNFSAAAGKPIIANEMIWAKNNRGDYKFTESYSYTIGPKVTSCCFIILDSSWLGISTDL